LHGGAGSHVTGTPSPSRCGRKPCKRLNLRSLYRFPAAKFVHPLGLSLNSSIHWAYRRLKCGIRWQYKTPPRWWRLIVRFYFQCSELSGAIWQVFAQFPGMGVTQCH
jgi:hypothetical protein